MLTKKRREDNEKCVTIINRKINKKIILEKNQKQLKKTWNIEWTILGWNN